MKRVLVVVVITILLTLTGCETKGEADLSGLIERNDKISTSDIQSEKSDGNKYYINDMLFLNENTTTNQIKERLGEPNAIGSQTLVGNFTIYEYALEDGGIVKIKISNNLTSNWGYIKYSDAIIVLFGTKDACEFIQKQEGAVTMKYLKDAY